MLLDTYIISPVEAHVAVTDNVDMAIRAYADSNVNTVLVPSPLAGLFDAAAREMCAPEIDLCAPFLERLRPWDMHGFKGLSSAQQDLIIQIKHKEDILSEIFGAVAGCGSYIDSLKYVPTRRSVYRTAIPHIDECDSHMTATLIGQRGTLLYFKDFTDIPESAFKNGEVQIKSHEVIETNPNHLCFIKGTDHADVIANPAMGARWHSTPVVTSAQEARLANFFALRNGLGCAPSIYG